MSQAAELLWYSTVGNGFKLDKVTGLRAYSTKRYKDHKVPIVWSTDHPGRSNLVLPVRAFCKVCFCTCLMRSEQVCCGFSVAFEMGCFINFHYRLDCMAEPGTRMPGSGWKTQMSWCASIIYYDNNLWSVAHYCYECFLPHWNNFLLYWNNVLFVLLYWNHDSVSSSDHSLIVRTADIFCAEMANTIHHHNPMLIYVWFRLTRSIWAAVPISWVQFLAMPHGRSREVDPGWYPFSLNPLGDSV